MNFYTRKIDRISDFAKWPDAQFHVIVERQISYMGDNYGPPDPPPSMETATLTDIYALDDQAQVVDWITEHTSARAYSTPAAYKVVMVTPVNVKTQVSISLS